ncbi:MYB DNA-binding domain protein [Pleurostoma richardsiae]|uniref:MYB DNA-binding domain protein n=1 Tax=Pleurostoma richardsiae TaxID=41990 RepID=A0AA38RMK2_9PEZI|nr:MYB DNA-binding domain protein [Pleurostoma richardsiae]
MQQWQVGPVPEYIYQNSTNHPNEMHTPHTYQQDMGRRNDQMDPYRYAPPPHQPAAQQHHQQHPTAVQPPMTVPQPQTASQPAPQPQQQTPTPAPAPSRQRKRPAPQAAPPPPAVSAPPPQTPQPAQQVPPPTAASQPSAPTSAVPQAGPTDDAGATPSQPPAKKSRTNTPWTPAEELRLKQMRDAGSSWAEIAKTFPSRTEGSVKKHWYKDMHYAEFAEDESQALLSAIKEYENNKWKVIGQKVGKPAKACEQYAKEHFPDIFATPKAR